MNITSKVKNYQVEIFDKLLERRHEFFSRAKLNRPFYFVDQKFYDVYRKSLEPFIGSDFYLCIEAKEENKSFAQLGNFYRALIERDFTRNDTLVTFGGGILQDISGFIASTLYRGIPWIFFPTTLLAQADSCIGSKTSINFENNKNLVGTFYPPDFIAIDVCFCQTLPSAYFNSGLGEIIKFHLLADRARFTYLKDILEGRDLRRDNMVLGEVILSTLKIKKSYFEEDEFDAGRRNLLNYGHCYGHALESASGFTVSHGEAVILGMGFANLLSLRRGLLARTTYNEIEEVLWRHYPHFDLSGIDTKNIINFLKRDKKRVGQDLTMILMQDIGAHIKMHDIKEAEIRLVDEEFKARICSRFSKIGEQT